MTKNDIVFGGKEVVKKKKKSENNYAKKQSYNLLYIRPLVRPLWPSCGMTRRPLLIVIYCLWLPLSSPRIALIALEN